MQGRRPELFANISVIFAKDGVEYHSCYLTGSSVLVNWIFEGLTTLICGVRWFL